MTENEMRQQGELRKARSIARLQIENVPTIDHLPWIECDPAALRNLEQIARRTIVISLLAVYAEPDGMPKDTLTKYLELRGINEDLTPKERAFVANVKPSEQERGPFTWQYESAHALLWAMGYVDNLEMPTKYCTAKGVSAIVAPRSLSQLMEGANLRSADEIFDECDLIYRYHWAARDASLHRREPPARLIVPVCYYRHYALNWLADAESDWDHVDTST